MELSTLSEFRHVPRWRGNWKLPEAERASVVMSPLTGIDVLVDRSDDDMRAWRDTRLGPLGNRDTHIKRMLPHLDMTALRIMQRIVEHTVECTGWSLRGEPVEDVAEIILRGFPGTGYGAEQTKCTACAGTGRITRPDGESVVCDTCNGSGMVEGDPQSLLMELNAVLSEASILTEGELGNWTWPSGGTASQTNVSATLVVAAVPQSDASTKTATPEVVPESESVD